MGNQCMVCEQRGEQLGMQKLASPRRVFSQNSTLDSRRSSAGNTACVKLLKSGEQRAKCLVLNSFKDCDQEPEDMDDTATSKATPLFIPLLPLRHSSSAKQNRAGRLEPSVLGPDLSGLATTYQPGHKIVSLKDQVEIEFSGQKTGRASINWLADGKKYSGQVRQMVPEGQGVMRWSNGDSYDGAWKMGVFHGKGKYTWCNGDVYSGEYINGVRCGSGHYVTGESEYMGQWKDGRPNGYGQLSHHNKGVIECNWKDGYPCADSSRTSYSSSLANSARRATSMQIVEEGIEQ